MGFFEGESMRVEGGRWFQGQIPEKACLVAVFQGENPETGGFGRKTGKDL